MQHPADRPLTTATTSNAVRTGSPVEWAVTGQRLFSWLRAGLQLSERIAPRWTPALAARAFCRPLAGRHPPARLNPPPGVRVQQLAFERGALTMYRWPAASDAPAVLLTHGWCGWGLQMAPLAQALQHAGWAPWVLDMPAHGRSGGRSSTLVQFVRALHHVAACTPSIQAVVAHSMGGGAACIAAASGLPVERLVLIAPHLDVEQLARQWVAAFGLSDATRGAILRYLELRERTRVELLSIAHNAPRVQTPTLLVHDRHDSIVPCASSRAFAEQLPRAQLLLTKGLGHRRVLTDADVHRRVVDFLAASATPVQGQRHLAPDGLDQLLAQRALSSS